MINPKFNIGDTFYYMYSVRIDNDMWSIRIDATIYKISEIIYDGKGNIFYTLASKIQNKEKIDTFRMSEEKLNNDKNLYKSRNLAYESAVNILNLAFDAIQEPNIEIKND